MKFCPATRPWSMDNIHQMNEDMIVMWNEKIAPEDLVYILGDVAFMQTERAIELVKRLNGIKILIEGNHDQKVLKDHRFRALFKEIHKYHVFNHNGIKVVMFHYPIFDHDQAGRGSIMLHGHRHGNPHGIPGRIMDVGFDATGEIAILLDDVVRDLLKVEPMAHH